MKKLFAILLIILILTSLCACSGTEDENTPETSPAETESPVILTEFDFGSTYGTSYNNTTMGIGISLPSEFTVTSTEELAKMNGFDEELMTTNLPKAMENTLRAYIFIAMDNSGNYMNIVAENLKIPEKAFVLGSEYFEFYTEETTTELEEMGAENITLTPSKVAIGGKEYDVQVVNYTLEGTDYNETKIAFPSGNFIAIMTLKGDTSLMLNRTYSLY